MQFDPVIAAVLAIIVGLMGYIYHLHAQRTRQPALDLQSLTSAVYDEALFSDAFPERDAYLDAKKQHLSAAGKAEDEKSVSDLPAEARKQLDGLMLKRAVAAIERGNGINRELENVRAMQSNGLLAPPQVQSIQAAIRAVEQEHRDIKEEANVVRHNWGEIIFRQAYSMSPSGVAALKEQREKATELKEKGGDSDRGVTAGISSAGAGVSAGASSGGAGGGVRERAEPARMSKAQEEQLRRKEAVAAKEADKVYQRLLEEEERNAQKKGSKKKDEGTGSGSNSKKGSK